MMRKPIECSIGRAGTPGNCKSPMNPRSPAARFQSGNPWPFIAVFSILLNSAALSNGDAAPRQKSKAH